MRVGRAILSWRGTDERPQSSSAGDLARALFQHRNRRHHRWTDAPTVCARACLRAVAFRWDFLMSSSWPSGDDACATSACRRGRRGIGGRRGELDAAVTLLGRGRQRMGGGAGGKARTRGARKSRAERDVATRLQTGRRRGQVARRIFVTMYYFVVQFNFHKFLRFYIFRPINAKRVYMPIMCYLLDSCRIYYTAKRIIKTNRK